MNVNDLVEAFGLPRNYATRLPAGSSIIATVKPDGSVAVEIRAATPPPWDVPVDQSPVLPVMEKRGPGRPRKAISE